MCHTMSMRRLTQLPVTWSKNHTNYSTQSKKHLEASNQRSLDLPERLELPERPPKYQKEQRIIGKYGSVYSPDRA